MTATTPSLREAAQIAERLRGACQSIRMKSFPLSDLIPLLQQAADALALPEAEPVAYRYKFKEDLQWQYTVNPEQAHRLAEVQRLYTVPQPSPVERKPLTDEQIMDIWCTTTPKL